MFGCAGNVLRLGCQVAHTLTIAFAYRHLSYFTWISRLTIVTHGGVFYLVFHLVEVCFYVKAAGETFECSVLGILVVAAEKVEAGVKGLKHNLRTMGEETKARMKRDQLRTSWHELRNSMSGTKSHLRPVIRKAEPYKTKLGHETKLFLDKAEVRTRRALTETIECTIDQLEKAKRRLNHDMDRGWHAA